MTNLKDMKNTKLLKSAKIIQPSSSFHLQSKDILITDGIITHIEDNISATQKLTHLLSEIDGTKLTPELVEDLETLKQEINKK